MTGTENVAHTFDPNGNITGIGNKALTYNQDNRLVRVEENSVTLGEYTYNGLGQRIIKTAGGTTTVFLYDFDGNIIAESDQTGSISKEYLYKGSSRLAMVDILAGKMYYYGNDKLGTPQIMTDSTNTVVWEADYKPFGEAEVNTNSSVVNNFRFPGQYEDEESGLHYNWNRCYYPRTGRYLIADSTGIQQRKNHLYVYVNNNPANLIDSLGLDPHTSKNPSNSCNDPLKECPKTPPLPSNSPECDKYGTDRYPASLGTSLRCFCKCAGDGPWSQQVRGCLRCMEEGVVSRFKSHLECYKAADVGSDRPNLRLIYRTNQHRH